MKAKSAIEKGKRFEKFLLDKLKIEVDANAHRTSGSGNGLDKADIRIPAHDIRLEAKNSKQINLIKDWEQAKSQAMQDEIPILAIRNPRKAEFQETLIVMDLGHFIEFLNQTKEETEVIETLGYQERRMLDNLIRSAKEILNKWEKV